MEDNNLFQYVYTLSDSPASDFSVLNMDSADTSGDAYSVINRNTHTNSMSSTFGQLSSFDRSNKHYPVPRASRWYKLPSDSTASNFEETTLDAHDDNPNPVSAISSDVAGKKLESIDHYFHMETIRDMESHCYIPHKPTYTKHAYRTPIIHQLTGSYLDEQIPNTGIILPSSHNARVSGNIDDMVPSAKKVYKRHSDKPPYSYVSMIIVAILNSDEKELTLAGIREKLLYMFPFFRCEYTGWRDSVRHTLSSNKCFYKVEKYDEQDRSNSSVWKVKPDFVKPEMFIRTTNKRDMEMYKLTLQEELGLPPFGCKVRDDNSACKDGIALPTKPCYHSEPESLVGSNDDLLNSRNDIVATPHSLVSDLDCAQSDNVPIVKTSRKRKRADEMQVIQTRTHPKQCMPSPLTIKNGQYMQSSDSVRLHDPFFNNYQTYLASVQQNDEIATRPCWFRESLYNGIDPRTFQPICYSNNRFRAVNDDKAAKRIAPGSTVQATT